MARHFSVVSAYSIPWLHGFLSKRSEWRSPLRAVGIHENLWSHVSAMGPQITISNLEYLFNSWLMLTTKLRFTGILLGDQSVIGRLPSQKVSYAKNVSTLRRHDGMPVCVILMSCSLRLMRSKYHKTTYISRIKSQNINDSRLALQLSLSN